MDDFALRLDRAQAYKTSGGDTQAPTAPANLSASGVSSTGFTLSWSASTDNVAVAGYDVYRGATKVNPSLITTTSYAVSGLSASTAYSMTVKAKDAAGNESAASAALSVTTTAATALRNPENPAATVAGVEYAYYEGTWDVLPNFASLTAVKTGNQAIFDLSNRNREDNLAFRFTGYVNVPADGSYTFYTSSDDGSKLFIGSTEVVNNDGVHAAQERSGTIGLKAGKHAISVVFFEKTGGELLTVSYAGPTISKTVIPASALSRATTTSSSTLVISAKGSCGTETMELRINDVAVMSWTNVSTLQADYSYGGFTGGNVKVAFTNESGPSTCDKNLYVDYIRIGSTTYQTETSATRVGTGSSDWLWSNAYFDFGTRSAARLRAATPEGGSAGGTLSPVPATAGKVTITLGGETGVQQAGAFAVALTTASGKLIKRASFTGRSGELGISEVKDGFYLVQISVGKQVYTRKLIVQRQ